MVMKKIFGALSMVAAIYSLTSVALRRGHYPKANGVYPYVLVLGAKVQRDGTPTNALRYRLDVAAAYATRYPHVHVIVSGGQGFDENHTEASVMKRYLTKQGIDAARITEEDRSTSTYENIVFTHKLLPEMTQVTIISNDYHLERAKVLAKWQSLKVDTLGAKTPGGIRRKVREREKLAILRAWLFGR
ncbi:vancomycin resistance protein [Kurthia sp. 3B1D]|uniref:Vancomycin resistance protein n=2 Tax=Candidatus Kurthia intestinigallinarum TaxID=1562256 RepID=A0A433RR15_9BACL|nr:vancomycin resistance protein [Kurthia sp. 3B1D]